MIIGILSLQGAFREHRMILESLGVKTKYIRFEEDLEGIDGLILPGGESTVMMKLLNSFGLLEPLKERIRSGLPTWGTCAGMILLSKDYLGLGDFSVKRNAYGTQLDSFDVIASVGDIEDYTLRFIRAPIISNVYGDTKILCQVDENIVAVVDRHMIATAFHPELTEDVRFHKYFINFVRSKG